MFPEFTAELVVRKL